MRVQLNPQRLEPAPRHHASSLHQHCGNRRQFSRQPVQKRGLIRLGALPAVACVVEDISAGGARIRIEAGQPVAQAFKLQIPNDLFEAECEVRYQSGPVVGVMFTSNRMEALAHYG